MNDAALCRYVLDTSVLVEAAKRYYAFDIAPGFWQQLKQSAQQGVIIIIDRVKDEIYKGKDELKQWFDNHFHANFFTTRNDDVFKAYATIMRWAQDQTQFTDAAKAELAKATNADAWLVSYGIAHGCIVVTQERFDPNIRRRIPIPNICEEFGVSYIDTFEMMRQLRMKL